MEDNRGKFIDLFEEHFNNNVNELMENFEWVSKDSPIPQNALNLEIIKDEAEDISDSYDYTLDRLTKIFYSKELDLYIKFEGREESYVGTTWQDTYTFVTPTEKTIQIFE